MFFLSRMPISAYPAIRPLLREPKRRKAFCDL